jgi:hypothetical protein
MSRSGPDPEHCINYVVSLLINLTVKNYKYRYRRCDSIDLPATSRPSDVSSSRAFSTLLVWKKKHSEPKDKTKQKDLSTVRLTRIFIHNGRKGTYIYVVFFFKVASHIHFFIPVFWKKFEQINPLDSRQNFVQLITSGKLCQPDITKPRHQCSGSVIRFGTDPDLLPSLAFNSRCQTIKFHSTFFASYGTYRRYQYCTHSSK